MNRDQRDRLTKARKAEAERVNDLFAGEGRFAGPTGYEAYHADLEQYRSDYAAVDQVLGADWQRRRRVLIALRSAAADLLWGPLHDKWIPKLLQKGPTYLTEMRRNIRRALAARRFADLFNLDTTLFASSGTAILVAAANIGGQVLAGHGGAPPNTGLEMVSGAALIALLESGLRALKAEIGDLTMFYQKALPLAKGAEAGTRSRSHPAV